MNSGSFFRLDLETSKVVSGITVFNYIDLPELDSIDDILKYPIRLSISSNCVSIFVHYFKNDDIPRHTEEVIINLPFDSDDKEALSSTIKRLYNTYFPQSNYLEELLSQRYISSNAKYANLRKSQINKDSYSSLYIWGLLERQTDGDFAYQLQNNGKVTKFLRKLLLDFMFDLMHSDVFECSKYYSKMRKNLMDDFFFSAIIKKSEFYYHRRLVRSRTETNFLLNDDKSFTENALKKLYAENLDKAEKEWVDVIMTPLADKHFLFCPEWYEEKVSTNKKENSFSISESWFIDPEEEMSRVVFPLPDEIVYTKIRYLNSFELSNLIGSEDKSSVIARNTNISKWYYRRFDFKDTFRLHLFDNANFIFTSLLWLFAISSVFSAFIPALWENSVYFTIFPLLCSILLFVICCFCTVSIYKLKSSKRLDDILLCIRRKRERKKSMYGALSFLCFTIFLFLSGYYNSIHYHIVAWAILLIAIFMLLGFNYKNRVVDNLHLLLPRLVASITTAWIMIVIGNDIVKEHLSIPIIVIITIIVFVFVLYENSKALPSQQPRKIIFRAIELIMISYSIAVIVGIYAINILSPSLATDAVTYTNSLVEHQWTFLGNFSEFNLMIYPTYLIPFSFLAMFIGVFIQMIFEEKNITEM
ncbi:MAG: hypothetical protein IJ190_07595 [Prevotella sp.]|nr:hypothetical protein [Prevotella sp.]